MTDIGQELAALLVDEHAAVYAYGLLGARLAVAERRSARAAFEAHRSARDALRSQLRMRRLDAPAAAAAYDVVARSPVEARALAVRVEEQLAVRWCDLVATTDEPALRRLAVQQLQECAVRATLWRQAQGVPPTVPFPGVA
ncbi:MAG TPA: DUF4439 domain-containing protein [Mycobacteriales bacterium]|nr:DUF4439 domain-containing protein [Mycobacteriales bacterium]